MARANFEHISLPVKKKPGKKGQSNLITSLMTCIVKTQKYQVKQTQKTGVATQETCDC